MSIRKNTERLIVFVMTDSAGLAKTGANVTAQVSKDGGAFAGSANGVSEISDGFYKLILTADEMNADVVAVQLTAPGCEQQNLIFYISLSGCPGVYEISTFVDGKKVEVRI